ncbi:MAG: SpoIIE family protein phosphatase [Cytophagales bacterium]|nr:SpoIIE family protein phosphatase [Cytophagales bacterium]MDW8383414.1 SpoIIE family protein phosphatase [Flammeovirgaceae bacterium]
MRFIVLILVFYCHLATSQRRGSLLFQRYSPQTSLVKASIWSLAQSPDGKLYAGTTEGIVEYDGTSWRKIEISNRADVRSIDIDAHGNIFVGGKGEFGQLVPNAIGELVYESFLPKIKEKSHLNFTDVWSSIATDSFLYFLTDEKLFIVHRQKDSIIIHQSEKKKFFLLFKAENRIFLYEIGKGIYQVQGGQLSLFCPYEKIGADVYQILPYDENYFLVITRNPELLLLHRSTGEITYFPTAVEKIFKRVRAYTAIRLPKPLVGKANFLFATYRTGILITDEKGDIIEHIEFENYGQESHATIWSVLIDQCGNIWAGMDGDLVKCELYQPMRKFGENNGLTSLVRGVFVHNNDIFITTARRGSYHLQGQQFKLLRKTADENNFGQAWRVIKFSPSEGEEQLLLGTSYGVFRITPVANLKKSATKVVFDSTEKYCLEEIAANRSTYRLVIRKSEPFRVYLGMYNGLSSLRWEKNQWVNEGIITDELGKITELLEDAQGNLWLGTSANGIMCLTIDTSRKILQKKIFNKENGFKYAYPRFYNIDGDFVVGTSDGLLFYNFNTESFEPYTKFGKEFEAKTNGRATEIICPDGKGNYWISGTDMILGSPLYLQKNEKGFSATALPFHRLPLMKIEQIFQHPEGSIWICGSNGLYIYNTLDSMFQRSPQISIRKIEIGKDSTLYMGAGINSSLTQLSYNFNRIVFEYSSPFFIEEHKNQYSYRLLGDNDEWSAWTTQTRKEYTNLFEGNYTFQVKAKNIYGVETPIAEYHFRILPPPYRSLWAYLFYTTLVIISIVGIVKVYSYKLLKDKERLEKIIEQRTSEIARQKQIIEEKNQDITASIRYAERIQKAILPQPDFLSSLFTEHFVIYKPRDIVSGDFYFCVQHEQKVILAAADCTGHGVPGALMSMIGVGLLNQIIFEKDITDASEILLSLHKGILNTLQQANTHNQDGMDIAICVWDKNHNIIEYAGAKNPLVIIENETISLLKGDPLGIGGLSQKERTFTKHTVSISLEKRFYIFSDGFQDQFGGKDNKKLTSKNFRNQLLVLANLPMKQQKESLETFLSEWKGKNEQNDDILVIGFRIG